ncbi:protein-tyrosine phosphatase family protein [Legionella maioricensis]|uniref:Tyrosine specific protein phosphatases domain-containing protein n=1 Tax=Legionella maioricensis TaxID=2896528 RepID=A0A9X2D2M7_9GAMM|nr:hypothetical protein [Legionella maioricensis]MCL9685127.1 hypothetical protein [Legionella maioricensis]MCL9688360.1 hypothetical protein [Legionella maioricensis]
MQEKLEKEFSRYFFLFPQLRRRNNSFGFAMFGGGNRDELSPIIPKLVYLGNLPRQLPFAPNIKLAETQDAGLVVSCVDLGELAESTLLLEPNSKNIKYHVVAMEDVTAKTGNLDQICDALHLMSAFADEKKPIHIHCYSGVGRSAMMTAAHLAHRYLMGDPVIKVYLDQAALKLGVKLEVEQEAFIPRLYKVSCKYVSSVRQCCQFDRQDRNEIAIKALTKLHEERKHGHSPYNDDYAFINALVQSASFKKLHHEYYNLLSRYTYLPATPSSELSVNRIDLQQVIKQFFSAFILNKEDWYQQLADSVNEEAAFKNTPLHQFCNSLPQGLNDEQQKSSMLKRRELLMELIETMNHLSLRYPMAQYSQPIIKAQELLASSLSEFPAANNTSHTW